MLEDGIENFGWAQRDGSDSSSYGFAHALHIITGLCNRGFNSLELREVAFVL